MTGARVPPEADTTLFPSPARMYDYYLGGKDNYETDREAAEVVLTAHPSARLAARNNREFLTRAVRCMVDQGGITQLIDLGSGIPTSPTPHEVARASRDTTQVAYVDEDPVVLAHGRAELGHSGLAVIAADAFDPAAVLSDEDLTDMIDLSQPVGLLAVAVLHFCAPEQLPAVLAGYRERLAPGSWVAFSAVTTDGLDADEVEALEHAYRDAARSLYPRSRAEITAMFDGYSLVDPGVVDVSQWRYAGEQSRLSVLAGVAQLS